MCDEELRLVQRWTGGQVADILRQQDATGGGLLVTDLWREQSIFELEPGLADYINERMRREGSNLSGVTTQFFAWAAIDPLQLTELLPGESEAVAAATAAASQRNCAVAMETDDSGSVTTLHKAPSSVATHIPASIKAGDDVIVDVVGDGSVRSSDSPKAKTAKNESNLPVTDISDMGIGSITADVNQQQQGQSTGKAIAFLGVCVAVLSPLYPLKTPTIHRHGMCFYTLVLIRLGEKREDANTFPNNVASTNTALNSSASPLDLLTEMRLRRTTTGNISNTGSFMASGGRCGGGGSSSLPGTPGSSIGGGGGGCGDSAPCTPLAHLSLSPASLEMHPSRAIDCLDVHFSIEAGELLPLAICDRLKHGRHFTFLNANSPEHAITLVPPGVTGAMVSPDVPFVSRGPWLQIYLPKDFLGQLERQFSILQYPEEVVLPLVFRWPERRLRICILDASNAQPPPPNAPPSVVPRSFPNSAPAFTPSSPLPPSIFPPGCVPPPQVLAAFINSQQCRGIGGLLGSASPPGSGASSSQSPSFLPQVPMGKPSPASAPHLSGPTAPSSALMEAMLSSFMSLYGNKGAFGGPFAVHPPPPSSDPSSARPPW
ncbi:unnamed protein product [Taenia asiatica]|uniref:Suppressor of fused C-terminal domain-containing protein n=1 Tax=Taenia asiatica TaxID=60517 RepID=A0A3P6PTJ4_TAEAS|nr:unnamed protein product [Taenia asiatica]